MMNLGAEDISALDDIQGTKQAKQLEQSMHEPGSFSREEAEEIVSILNPEMGPLGFLTCRPMLSNALFPLIGIATHCVPLPNAFDGASANWPYFIWFFVAHKLASIISCYL